MQYVPQNSPRRFRCDLKSFGRYLDSFVISMQYIQKMGDYRAHTVQPSNMALSVKILHFCYPSLALLLCKFRALRICFNIVCQGVLQMFISAYTTALSITSLQCAIVVVVWAGLSLSLTELAKANINMVHVCLFPNCTNKMIK